MNELKECFEEYVERTSGKFRRRSYIVPTKNEDLLMTPSPPSSNVPRLEQTLKSNSMTLPKTIPIVSLESTKLIEPIDSKAPHSFYCKNSSLTLSSLLSTSTDERNIRHEVGDPSAYSVSLPEEYVVQETLEPLPNIAIFDHDAFDVNERIIPAYYINSNGIKVGALHFNFYTSVIDSIRNMRILTPQQLVFLENCTREEYMEIVMEYNKVIRMLDFISST